MRNLKFLAAFALLCLFVSAIGPANAGVANPPTHELPPNPAKWCTATPVKPGTTLTTQLGDCPAPPPTACPAGRQVVADVCYNYSLATNTCARNVNVTEFANIWGRTSPTGPITPFPGAQFFAIIKNMQKDGYIAAKFVAGTTLPPDASGMFSHGETIPGPNLTMSISTQCGSFSTPAEPICTRTNQGPGSLLTKWKVPTAPGVACTLIPGQTYYVNLKFTNPPASHFDCTGPVCKATVQHNHTP